MTDYKKDIQFKQSHDPKNKSHIACMACVRVCMCVSVCVYIQYERKEKEVGSVYLARPPLLPPYKKKEYRNTA